MPVGTLLEPGFPGEAALARFGVGRALIFCVQVQDNITKIEQRMHQTLPSSFYKFHQVGGERVLHLHLLSPRWRSFVVVSVCDLGPVHRGVGLTLWG